MLHIRTQPSLNRDFALLSLFIVFLMIMMSAWVAYETFDSQKKQITERMQQAAARMDTTLSLEIQHAGYVIEALGRQLLDSDVDNLQRISKLFQSFDKFDNSSKAIFSWITRDQQLTVTSHFGVLDNPIDVSDRDYVKRALTEPWKISMGRPIKGRISKRWVVPLSIGLSAEDGTFLGVLYMGLIIENIKAEAIKAVGDSDINFAITNRAFTTLTDTAGEDQSFKRYFDLTRLTELDFMAPQASMYSTALPWNSRTVFAYYQTAKEHPFVYFLTFNREASSDMLQTALIARISQLVAVGAFLLFVLWTVRKRIIQPVITLSQHTRAATLGSTFDANTNEGPQEIQNLTREIYKFWLFIQERKRIEAELRLKLAELIRIRESATLTNQVKAEFFSFVGDALRAPIQMIMEQSETIKDQHFGPITNPKYLKNADDIYLSSGAVIGMLHDMMKISAAENGLISLKEENIDTQRMLQKTIKLFHEEYGHNFQIQLDSASPFPHLFADKLRMKQLFLNVLNIAAQQISSGDVIRISSNIRSGELNMFFAFAHDARRNASIQTLNISMAVALARLLIAMHHGSFEIKTTPERVTTITLRFPSSRLI